MRQGQEATSGAYGSGTPPVLGSRTTQSRRNHQGIPVSSIGSVLSRRDGQSSPADLPAQVVYYVIALRCTCSRPTGSTACLLEAVQCCAIHRWARVQANRASLRPARGGLELCESCTMSWSSLWRYVVREGLVSELAAGESGCSTFDVADEKANEDASLARSQPRFECLSADRFVSWWRMARTCCLAARWMVTGRANHAGQSSASTPESNMLAWLTEISSASSCGSRRRAQARTCSGDEENMRWLEKRLPMVLFEPSVSLAARLAAENNGVVLR